ncbi:hypothetical protein [Ornithinimicrobium sediminis]|uniref:hypothetical protein n=1 Tax=Ornithinimicrobium sediminis TaxID=2904603 RepID=UPI001E40D51F|nr:hypothetical protein [Ornithinimicrobium sediminis]MCE0485481.1 hypothetical protein [Ornithinimicrobium sediminis]
MLSVLGCHGSAGATTVAVAVATVLGQPVRVVETGPDGSSGLAGFATAELGATGTGWVRGRRDQVILDRLQDGYASPDQVPVPDPDPAEGLSLNVLDPGWGLGAVALSAGGWVRSTVMDARALILVTTATVPGLRRLERDLHDLGPVQRRLAVAVHGPGRRRWPREVAYCVGPRTDALLEEASVHVPHDPGLAVRGLDTCPLPYGVLGAIRSITQLLGLDNAATHYQKGNT